MLKYFKELFSINSISRGINTIDVIISLFVVSIGLTIVFMLFNTSKVFDNIILLSDYRTHLIESLAEDVVNTPLHLVHIDDEFDRKIEFNLSVDKRLNVEVSGSDLYGTSVQLLDNVPLSDIYFTSSELSDEDYRKSIPGVLKDTLVSCTYEGVLLGGDGVGFIDVYLDCNVGDYRLDRGKPFVVRKYIGR